jgi:aldose 1-epimerase
MPVMLQRYAISSETRGGVEIFTLREADTAFAEVAPAWGNNCIAFHVQAPILEPVPFEELRQRPTRYGNPILFPFPNRIRGGEFRFQSQRYVVNPSRHGFVRDKPWKMLGTGASNDEGAWIRSALDARDYPEAILNQYPFPFHLEVTYRLMDSTLRMETVVRNTGEQEMPLGFGIHPYFRRPEQGAVQVPARKRWELVDSLPTGRVLDVEGAYDLRSPRDVTNLALDDILTDLIPSPGGSVRCILEDQKANLQTVVEFEARQFPHVVVYTAPAPRQAICIEPNTCPTDAFNLQDRGIESNVIVLPARESMTFSLSISGCTQRSTTHG